MHTYTHAHEYIQIFNENEICCASEKKTGDKNV